MAQMFLLSGVSAASTNQLYATNAPVVRWWQGTQTAHGCSNIGSPWFVNSTDIVPVWYDWQIQQTVVDDSVDPISQDNFCINLNAKVQSSGLKVAYRLDLPSPVQARTYMSLFTRNSVSETIFQTAKIILGIGNNDWSNWEKSQSFTGTNVVYSNATLRNLSKFEVVVSYNVTTIEQSINLCLDSMFAFREYYLNPYIKISQYSYTVNGKETFDSNKTVTEHFSSSFTTGPKCPAPYSFSGAIQIRLRVDFGSNVANSPFESVLLTSYLVQFQSKTQAFFNAQKWNYTSLWETSTLTQQDPLDLNNFNKISPPEIINRVNFVDKNTNSLNLCTVQMFGFAFCEVTALVAAIIMPIVTPTTPSTTLIDSDQNVTFQVNVSAQYDAGKLHNTFCSLGLQLIVTLNGQTQNVTFGIDVNKTLTPTISTWVLNTVSQQISFTLNPVDLIVTAVLINGTIFATTNSQLIIVFQVIDSRDTKQPTVNTTSQFTFNYTCNPIGLSTGTLSFEDSNLSDNKTLIYYTGQGIIRIGFQQKDPYCTSYTGKTYIGYFYDSNAGRYTEMNTDSIQFENCRNSQKTTCFLWSQSNSMVSFFSFYGARSPIQIKIEIIFQGLAFTTTQQLTINRFLKIDAIDSCKNTVFSHFVTHNNQTYSQNLSLAIDDRSGQIYSYQVNFQDSCSINNPTLCNSVGDCGLYWYNLRASTTDLNYQRAQNLLESGSGLQTQINSDSKSIILAISSSIGIYAGLQLAYNLEVGLVNFNQLYPDQDPKRLYNLTITFVDFYPRITTINIDYRIGIANEKIKLPAFVISPDNFKIVSIMMQQIAGTTIPSTQYYFNTTEMTFQIQTNNQQYANSSATFNFIATLDDPLNVKNSDLQIYISFVAADLVDVLRLNTPPYFTTAIDLPKPILCLSSNSAQFWNLNLPIAVDDQLNSISLAMNCQSINNDVFLVKEIKPSVFNLMLNTTFSSFGPRGQSNCKLILSDSHNAKKSYDLSFNNLCSTDLWSVNQNSSKKQNYTAPFPKISEITNKGQVTLTWNIKLIPPQNTSQQNQLNSCFGKSPVELAIKVGNFKGESLNLNFTISNFTYSVYETKFDVIFEQPQFISFYAPDSLHLSLTNTQCFQSIENNFFDTKIVLEKQLPKQLSMNVVQVPPQIKSVAIAIMYTSVTTVILSFFTKAVFNFLLGMISNLSFMLHMFLVKLNFPVELQNYMNIFFPLITFSIIPTEEIFETLFKFSEIQTDYPLTDQFSAVGYASIFFVQNIGFLYFNLQFGLLVIFALWITTQLQIFACEKYFQNILDNLTKQFIWNGLISFCNQNYLLICVVSFIESNDLRLGPNYTATENYCSVLAIIGIVFAFAFPSVLFLTYRNLVRQENIQFTAQEKINIMVRYNIKYEEFSDPRYVYHSNAYQSFINSHGILLQDIDIAKTGPTLAVLSPVVDLAVQLLLAIAVTRLVNWPILQIFSFNFILLAYLLFFIQYSPYKERQTQFWAIFDKLVLLALNYHLFLFTDFVTEPDRYAQIANSVIYIVSGCSVLRVSLEMITIVWSMIQYTKQFYPAYVQRRNRQQIKFQRMMKALNLKSILKSQNSKKANESQNPNLVKQEKKVKFLEEMKHQEQLQIGTKTIPPAIDISIANQELKREKTKKKLQRQQANQQPQQTQKQSKSISSRVTVRKEDPIQSHIQHWVPNTQQQQNQINLYEELSGYTLPQNIFESQRQIQSQQQQIGSQDLTFRQQPQSSNQLQLKDQVPQFNFKYEWDINMDASVDKIQNFSSNDPAPVWLIDRQSIYNNDQSQEVDKVVRQQKRYFYQ